MQPFNFKKQRTIGLYVIKWIESNLKNLTNAQPYILQPDQLNFLLHWYSVDDNANFIYRRGVYRRAKGCGKSPFAAAICLAEMCAPVIPYFHKGALKAKPITQPWVCIAAYSESQAQNVYHAILGMIEESTISSKYKLDVGLTRIYSPNGGRIICITSSAKTIEGGRYTFVASDETHLWEESTGTTHLIDTIRRNLGKTNGRSIEFTNAHRPGNNSVAEQTYLAYQKALEHKKNIGILYDSIEAPASTDIYDKKHNLREGIKEAYKFAPWVNIDRIIEEIYDPNTHISDSRRFYLNHIVAAEDSWISPVDLNKCVDKTLLLQEHDEVILGFDGSRTNDSTVLVALRVEDCAFFLLGIWEKPLGAAGANWIVDMSDVRNTVAYAFNRYSVIGFLSDVKEWETDIDNWYDEYRERLLIKASTRHAIAYDMRGHQYEITMNLESLNRAFLEKAIKYDGNLSLTRHLLNARRRLNRFGTSFGKEHRESPKKVDALAALLLAYIGYKKYITTDVRQRAIGFTA